jgi:hypothetical protein
MNTNTKEIIMILKDVVALLREAVAVEAQEGVALQAAKEAAELQVKELSAKVAELVVALEGASAETQAKAQEIADATEGLASLVESIKAINPTPIADVVKEVEAAKEEDAVAAEEA